MLKMRAVDMNRALLPSIGRMSIREPRERERRSTYLQRQEKEAK